VERPTTDGWSPPSPWCDHRDRPAIWPNRQTALCRAHRTAAAPQRCSPSPSGDNCP
jgi:hypothetical protein